MYVYWTLCASAISTLCFVFTTMTIRDRQDLFLSFAVIYVAFCKRWIIKIHIRRI